MKVIDLLNKIVNGEEVPNRIKCNNKIFEYHDNSKNYYDIENHEEPLFNEAIAIFLNEEVELIEEDTIEIETIVYVDKIIKVFEDIGMCLKRLSVKISSAGQGSIDNYIDRYDYDLQAVKQLKKEIKELKEK